MGNGRVNWSLLGSAVSANLLSLCCGLAYSFTSPVLPKLNGQIHNDNPLGRVITPFEESWIASLINLGAIVGPIISGYIVDRIGRKRVLLLSSVPILISYIMFYFSRTINLYYVSRFILGLGVGCVYSIIPMYIGEISEETNRGSFGCLLTIFQTIGLLYGYSIGPFITIHSFCIACIVPALLFFIFFAIFGQESPYHLIRNKQIKRAEHSLRRLRINSTAIGKEIELIQSDMETTTGDVVKFRQVLLNRSMAIGAGLMFFQQFSGIPVMMVYMQSIFESAKTNIAPEISAIIVAIIQLLCNLIVTQLVERLGRRILLITSSIGVVLSNFLLGLFFYLKTNNYEIVDHLLWLPLFSLTLWVITFNSGLGPVGWAIIGELFPVDYKSTATTVTTVVCLAVSFIMTVFFPNLNLVIGIGATFWLLAGISFVGTGFFYYYIPETKGKTLQEIQELLRNNYK